MKKIIEEIIKELEDYYNIKFDDKLGGYEYMEKSLNQVYLAGKIRGLKEAIELRKGDK